MKAGKVGCLFIYSIFLIIFGMMFYKYRTEIFDFLKIKYNQASAYAKETTDKTINDVKDKIN